MNVPKNEIEQRTADLRTRLLQQTTRVVRRQRYVRRFGIVVACAGCYAAGLLTVWGMQGESATEPVSQSVVIKPAEAEAVPTQPEPRVAIETKLQPEQQTTITKITRPPREKKSKFEKLRELGDRYMLDHQDLAGATRCYQMALRYATAEDFKQQADDGTWLYRALKLDQQRENERAQDQG